MNRRDSEVKHGLQEVHVALRVCFAVCSVLLTLCGALLHEIYMTTLLEVEFLLLKSDFGELSFANRHSELCLTPFP